MDARDFFIAQQTSALEGLTKANWLARLALLDQAMAQDPDYSFALVQAAVSRDCGRRFLPAR